MQYESILTQRDGAVATVTINRPEQRNALTTQTLVDLESALGALGADDAVHVIVLRGAGDRAFCAGADLKEVLAAEGLLAQRRYFGGVASLLEAMARCPVPIVSMVHGFALAGGCGLAVAPEFTIAADDAEFGLPEVKIGLLPMTVMAPIARCVGRKQAVKFMMLGERVNAEEALRIGLATEVHPKADLEDRTYTLAEKLAALSPATLALAKEGLYTMTDMEYFKSLHYLREMIAITANTDDAKEGIRAFFEKRKPEWKGK